ncbi:hypothetical protein AKJ37_03585 [candidate division MSBL1 archaeon SCGC-AAA259I09]|uniref:Uncharacterized protein n=1 Tax=candidate division MSBL1 archaeon SCGC-AAA259I09 TaxID=1698267 RepID=A0A133USU8_9EURY|nr:hypothetical protein AKJ37_03585 [candidate division MSBL1 archaeon SCGC-AAA259I09]
MGLIKNGDFVLADDSFARYYHHIGYGETPGFGISLRERNIAGGIFISGNIDCITKKGVELAKILEKSLEQ